MPIAERFWKPLWGLFLVLLLGVLLGFARRPFWYDELFTLYIAQMPAEKMWSALLSGVDQNSPLFYLLSGMTSKWMEFPEPGLRLPALFGGLTALTCVFLYVKDTCGVAWGWVAAWLLLASHAAYYMAEARPYGLLMGFTALALLAWRRRIYWLMSLALVLAALSHAYALLIFLPLAIGQYARREPDRKPWFFLAASLAAFAIYVPISGGVKGTMAYSWAKPELSKIPEAYLDYLGSATPLAIALVLLVIFWPKSTDAPTPSADSAALIALSLLPLTGLALGKFTGIYAPRYTIECTVGLAILFTLALHRATHGSRTFAVTVCALVFSWQLYTFFSAALQIDTRNLPQPLKKEDGRLASIYDLLPYAERSDLPLVVSSGLMFLEIDHYATGPLTSRLHVLLDEKTAIEHTSVNVTEVGLPLMKKWFPIRAAVDPYAAFTAANPRFLVYGFWESRTANDWLIYRLMKDGYSVRVIARTDRAWREPPWTPGINDSRYLYLFEVTHLPSTENASSTLPGAPPRLP